VAAGSSITEDVPAEALGIARSRQANKEGWVKARAAAAKKESSNLPGGAPPLAAFAKGGCDESPCDAHVHTLL
jgi:hypothetical protein